MLFYLCIIFVLIILSIGKIKGINDNKILAMGMVFFWFLATFRSLKIGNDTQNYYDLFNSIRTRGGIDYYTGRYELGYLMLNRWIGYFSGNFTVFLGLINAFIYWVYYEFIKKFSKNKIMSLLIFVTLGFWGYTLNIIRLQIAVACVILAYMMKEKKRVFSALTCALISVSFQKISAINMLVLFVPNRINKKIYGVLGIVSVFSYLLLEEIINIVIQFVPYYSSYLKAGSSYHFGEVKLASVIDVIMRLLIFILAIWAYKHSKGEVYNSKKQCSELARQTNMIFISLLISIISLKFNLLDRCGIFFWSFVILLLPNSIAVQNNINNRRILMILIVLISVAYFVVINIFRPEWNHIYPYESVFYNAYR